MRVPMKRERKNKKKKSPSDQSAEGNEVCLDCGSWIGRDEEFIAVPWPTGGPDAYFHFKKCPSASDELPTIAA